MFMINGKKTWEYVGKKILSDRKQISGKKMCPVNIFKYCQTNYFQ